MGVETLGMVGFRSVFAPQNTENDAKAVLSAVHAIFMLSAPTNLDCEEASFSGRYIASKAHFGDCPRIEFADAEIHGRSAPGKKTTPPEFQRALKCLFWNGCAGYHQSPNEYRRPRVTV